MKPIPNPKETCDFVLPDGKVCGKIVGKNQMPQHKLMAHKFDVTAGGGKGRKVAFPRREPPAPTGQTAPTGGGPSAPTGGGGARQMGPGVMPPLSGIWETIGAVENMVLVNPKVVVSPEFSRAMDHNLAAAAGQGAVHPIAGLVIGIVGVYVIPGVGNLLIYIAERRKEANAAKGAQTVEQVRENAERQSRPVSFAERMKGAVLGPSKKIAPHKPQHVVVTALGPEAEAEQLRAQMAELKAKKAVLDADAAPGKPPLSKGLPGSGRLKKKAAPTGRGGRER